MDDDDDSPVSVMMEPTRFERSDFVEWGKTGGRPKFEVTPEVVVTVERLSALHCTQIEIAGVLGCTARTLRNKLKKHAELQMAYERGRAVAKVSLRRTMWTRALDGCPKMLRWLSANELGYRDRVEAQNQNVNIAKVVIHYDDNGRGPKRPVIDVDAVEVLEEDDE